MQKIRFFAFMSKTFVSSLFLFWLAANGAAQDKMKPEEIIAKHVESLGATATIATVKSRLFQGKAQARLVNSAVDTTVKGKSYIVSAGEKMLIQMNFESMTSADYSREHIGFDGKKINTPLITESKPSALGDFVSDYKEIIKQGLLGGTLITNWALLDAKNRIGKFEYQGKEKIGDAETHVLRCVPRGGSGLTIKMFFDAQNFRHLRTTYYQETAPPVTLSDEGRVSSIRYKLIEDFQNHKTISGLTLPTVYKINYTVESPARLRQYEWQLDLSRFEFNVDIKPELFQ